MSKMESVVKSEIFRLARREVHKVLVPLRRDVRSSSRTVSQLRKSVAELERFRITQKKELAKREIKLEVSPEEMKKARFSPRLIRSLRKHLGTTQKELATLLGVTIGAVQSWEAGKFKPAGPKRRVLVGVRKLDRREVRRILEKRNGTKTR